MFPGGTSQCVLHPPGPLGSLPGESCRFGLGLPLPAPRGQEGTEKSLRPAHSPLLWLLFPAVPSPGGAGGGRPSRGPLGSRPDSGGRLEEVDDPAEGLDAPARGLPVGEAAEVAPLHQVHAPAVVGLLVQDPPRARAGAGSGDGCRAVQGHWQAGFPVLPRTSPAASPPDPSPPLTLGNPGGPQPCSWLISSPSSTVLSLFCQRWG